MCVAPLFLFMAPSKNMLRRNLIPKMGCLFLAFGCIESAQVPSGSNLDVAFFECNIQPIVDRSCAFVACHGDPGRPLHVYSTSKVRIAGEALIGEELTNRELCANFYSAAAHAQPDERSQLITKPTTLDGFASQYHAGNYLFRADAPEAKCLLMWMKGEKSDTATASLSPAEYQMPWQPTRRRCKPRTVNCETAILEDALPENL